MEQVSTPHPVNKLSALGGFVRIVLGFAIGIPLLYALGIFFMAAFFPLLGLSGFFEFVVTHIRDYLGSIALSLISLPLLVMLLEERKVAIPMALVTGVASVVQQGELANIAALLGIPASLFLVGEEYLSKTKKRGLAMQLLVLVSSTIVGFIIGALLMLLRNWIWM